MNILVTGGAGFIGRWVVKRLLEDGHSIWILDNLSSGSFENIKNFVEGNEHVKFIEGDITDKQVISSVFKEEFDLCYHLAASINVQDSIDSPEQTFTNDTIGTFIILQECKKHKVKLVFMSTCMVYDKAIKLKGINENHPTKPVSPYAGSKIASENMVLSYYYAYGLPTVVIRPFNTYGPYQKTTGEGGVVSIFINNKLQGKDINIYGDGLQTRDLLYVEDCAEFVAISGYSNKTNGHIINAGCGVDISINDLAKLIVNDESRIKHIPHIHPQSEIQKLLCDYSKAEKLLCWTPSVDITSGIEKTQEWISRQIVKGE
ncbi:SDR family NAD(P)-dependent oxidoreductase [Clostridiaceae bacterium M8S5]|nr:SDR family NAD(P)-dependent oxidoreductase [Clostridiaceae bacterium M8S5]